MIPPDRVTTQPTTYNINGPQKSGSLTAPFILVALQMTGAYQMLWESFLQMKKQAAAIKIL